jgi:hypothetical protein
MGSTVLLAVSPSYGIQLNRLNSDSDGKFPEIFTGGKFPEIFVIVSGKVSDLVSVSAA